jgi:DNA polymerase-3 subunit gamma/tau
MSYQVLARKWRPKRFDEVVGQEHVTRSLQNALRLQKLAHAYLLTGTRGVGKTTIARLFAKAIRCEARTPDFNPCNQCVSCKDIEQGNSLDYQEIDGASHNGVENIRELIENVRYLPARGAYKLYVIDEVHMLSTPAFNALLKTLEEPPAHVIFVFATTDAHKLLGTVLSRCQRFDFKNVAIEILASHVSHVAKAEGIKFQDPALVRRLAEYGKGSVRDTLSLFDQVLSLAGGQTIDETTFYQALGLARAGALSDLLGAVVTAKPLEASSIFQSLLQENIDLKRLVDQLLDTCYAIIQKIDDPVSIYSAKLLPQDALLGITYAELFWIFETFTKDCVWGLESPAPEKVIDLSLQKIARRRQILKPDQGQIQAGVAVSTTTSSAPRPAVKAAPPAKMESLLASLTDAPTIRANLEMGDFVEKPRFVEDTLHLVVGFPESETMPADYLQDPDVNPKFKTVVARFYGTTEAKVQVKFVTVSNVEAHQTGFTSVSQRETKKQADELAERKDKILNAPFVKEAERLFNAKVDKVILKDSKV